MKKTIKFTKGRKDLKLENIDLLRAWPNDSNVHLKTENIKEDDILKIKQWG